MYLERKIDNDLYIWQHNVNDVLVVQGPPCVGKTTSIQHYVKENFEHYYIIDLEDKIGKKFSNKFSNDIQNSKDFSQDLSQDGDTHGLHPVFSFIYNNEGALDNTKNSVLIIKNLQFSKDPTGLINYLNQFDFRLICTLEDSLAKYSNIVCSPLTYIAKMTGITFQEFLGLYGAEEDYITTVDGIGVQEADGRNDKNGKHNPDGEESSDKASKVLKNNNYNLGIALNNSASLLSSYMSNSKANLSSLTSSDKGRLIFAAIAAHSNNWFFSQDAYKYLSGHRNDFIDAWNKLYPSENVSSSKALAQVKSRISNLNTAIKNISGESLTSAQTKTVYETNSDYDDSKYNKKRGWGSVYCVVNKKIKYADGKNHTLVSCYDLVGGGYLVSACMMGKYVYAKMLKVSGVGIDPTNPATYLNNLAKSGTYVPGGSNSSSNNGSSSTNSKVNTWLSQQGIEVSTLAPKQVSLMEGIYGRLGTKPAGIVKVVTVIVMIQTIRPI